MITANIWSALFNPPTPTATSSSSGQMSLSLVKTNRPAKSCRLLKTKWKAKSLEKDCRIVVFLHPLLRGKKSHNQYNVRKKAHNIEQWEKNPLKNWPARFYGLANGSYEADTRITRMQLQKIVSECVGGEHTINPYSIKHPECSEHHGKCSSSSKCYKSRSKVLKTKQN